jgi:hypothetical protein
MSHTKTLPAPTAAKGVTHDDDVSHLVCCDDNTALCGLDVTNLPFLDSPDDVDCPLCVLADDSDFSCPALDCPWRIS